MINLHISPENGTKVLGSIYGELLLEPKGEPVFNFSGIAKVKVDPAYDKKYSHWWIIAYTCDNITAYYRYSIKKRFGIVLRKPSFGAHISIIAGEKPKQNIDYWKYFDGFEKPFEYTHQLYTNGTFWWLNVKSEEMEFIRDFFGLDDSSKDPLHLTIGRI